MANDGVIATRASPPAASRDAARIDWNFGGPTTGPACTAHNDRMREVALALTEIPADDLVVQWDVAWEFVDMAIGAKRLFAFHPELTAEEKFQRYAAQLDDLWQDVPDEALLGYHWCYGTWGGWPMVAMDDLSLCVRLSNEAARRTGRRLTTCTCRSQATDRRVLRPARRPRHR